MADAPVTIGEQYDAVLFDAVMRDFYRSEYYNVGWWDDVPSTPADACAALVRRVIERVRRSPGRVLDAGCGLGGATRQLAGAWPVAEIVGIGVSERQLACCREILPAAKFLRMDAARLDFPAGTFDAVVGIESALHFDTRARFFAEAYRVLRDGGTLALSDLLVPSQDWPGAWSIPPANLGCDAAAYATLLRDAGFRDARVDDVTARCWGGYLRSFQAFGAERDEDQPGTAAWRTIARLLASAAAPTYVLASARR
jgi:MPBQ/MSBQ methyltransferase